MNIGDYVTGQGSPVKWTRQSRLFYNVKDYGAVGDASTDDTAAFNLAIAEANSTGGTIYMPDPSAGYLIGALDPIYLDGVIVKGESERCWLRPNTEDAVFTIGKYVSGVGVYTPIQVIFENFLVYNTVNRPAAYFRFANARNCLLDKIRFAGDPKVGVEGVTIYGLTERDPYMKWFNADRFHLWHYNQQIATPIEDTGIDPATDVNITDNQFENLADDTSSQRYTGASIFIASTGNPPAPLKNGNCYFVIRVDTTTIKLAYTQEEAIAGTAVNLTDTGTGLHSLYVYWAWSNSCKIEGNGYFSPSTSTGTNRCVEIHGGGAHQIEGMFEAFKTNNKIIYIDSANYAWTKGLTIINPYIEQNTCNFLEINDDNTWNDNFTVVGGFHSDSTFNLGLKGRGTFIGCDPYAAGDLVITAASGSAQATLIGCKNYTTSIANMTVIDETDIYTYPLTIGTGGANVQGFSAVSYNHFRYKKLGKTVRCYYAFQGTSNATTIQFTLPYTPHASFNIRIPVRVEDAGVYQADPGMLQIGSGSTTVTIYKTLASGPFTTSGEKYSEGEFFYDTS